MYTTDGRNAGLLARRLGDGSPRTTQWVEHQAWWAQSGIVLP